MFLYFIQGHNILTGYQADGMAVMSCPPRPADPMDVTVQFFGNIIVDDQGQIVNVDAAGSHVRGNQDIVFPSLELLNVSHTFCLGDIPVEGAAVITLSDQKVLHPVHCCTGIAENHARFRTFHQENPV